MVFYHNSTNPNIPAEEYLGCLKILQLWIKQLWTFSYRFLHWCNISNPVFGFLWAWLVSVSWKVCGWFCKNLSNSIPSCFCSFIFLLVMFQILSSLLCHRVSDLRLFICIFPLTTEMGYLYLCIFDHLDNLFCDISVNVLCPSFNWVVWSFTMHYIFD